MLKIKNLAIALVVILVAMASTSCKTDRKVRMYYYYKHFQGAPQFYRYDPRETYAIQAEFLYSNASKRQVRNALNSIHANLLVKLIVLY
jgi:hypothetical protein